MKQKILISAMLTVALWLINIPYLDLLLGTILLFYGGMFFLKGAYHEIKSKKPGMMALVSLGLLSSYVYSLIMPDKMWVEMGMLITIMLLGHYIEMISLREARKYNKRLLELLPSRAVVEKEGRLIEVSVESIKKGDVVVVKEGERIPVDGIVVEGEAQIDLSMITGESKPVSVRVGEQVYGGSTVKKGWIKIRATASKDEGYLAHLDRMVEEGMKVKSKYQDLGEKAAGVLFYVSLFFAVVALLLYYNVGVKEALERAIAVLVIACPHALGLAIPMVLYVSNKRLSQKGILIKNKQGLDKLKDVKTVVFDKTGTLTKGQYRVIKHKQYSDELFYVVAALESKSNHPIAYALLEYVKIQDYPAVEDYSVVEGLGIKGKINNKEYLIGGLSLLKKLGLEAEEGNIYVICDGKILGWFLVEDEIREEAKDAVEMLKKKGINVLMLTGDNEKEAKKVADYLGIPYYAELTPQDKVEHIKKMSNVCFVGDGINDAPVIAYADVGISMNALDITMSAADFILAKNDLRKVPYLIDSAREIHNKMRENILLAISYNVVALPAAAGIIPEIFIPPALAAILMSLNDILVVINAQRIKI